MLHKQKNTRTSLTQIQCVRNKDVYSLTISQDFKFPEKTDDGKKLHL